MPMLPRPFLVALFSSQPGNHIILSFHAHMFRRHTWNNATREQGRLLVPETELYELLTVQRRRLVEFSRTLVQYDFDEVLQCALQVSTSTTGSLRASTDMVAAANRWNYLKGDRSIGRFAVGSQRKGGKQMDSQGKLVRTASSGDMPTEVVDSLQLGVEMDLQIGQMTLRSKHLTALDSSIANQPDVSLIFGNSTMQASLVEKAQNRQRYNLVGKDHDLEYWPTAHTLTPAVADELGRIYDPAELFPSEAWIARVFEPIRESFFAGRSPTQFMMPEFPLPEDAEVAVLVGLHQILGGPFKICIVFKRLKCVNAFEVNGILLTEERSLIADRLCHTVANIGAASSLQPIHDTHSVSCNPTRELAKGHTHTGGSMARWHRRPPGMLVCSITTLNWEQQTAC